MPSKFPFTTGARYKDDPRDYAYSRAPLVRAAISLDRPAKVDNRHLFDGIPVGNQGKEGACVGFAVSAVVGHLYGKHLSERMAYELGREYDEWPGKSYDGTSVRGASGGVVAEGDCEGWLWPFVPFDIDTKLEGAEENALQYRLARYERLRGLQEILDAIWQHDCVVATVEVHTGWARPTRNHRIRYSSRYIQRGLHAIVKCGYDEHAGYFLVRNSWRDDWGDGGYAWLKFDDWFNNGYDCWALFKPEIECPNGSG